MKTLKWWLTAADGFGPSLAPETWIELEAFEILVQDEVRQAKAERALVLRVRLTAWLRCWRSLAWWRTAVQYGQWFDPVGEILKPIATGPSLVHFQKEENGDGTR